MADNDKTNNTLSKDEVLDVLRKIFSTVLTFAALGLIIYAIGMNYAALPGHPVVHYILFLFVLVLLGYLEGLQIAILELEKTRLPKNEAFRKKYPRAMHSHKLATADNGLNVQRFLIGRQFFVVFVVFLCAQLTTYPTLPKDGWPEWLFVLVIDTGLPGALVVLGFAQLMPQLVAATHPVAFMNLHGAWSVIKLALILENVGIAHCAWVLASFVKKVFHYKGVVESISGIASHHPHEEGDGRKKENVVLSTDDWLLESSSGERNLFIPSKEATVSSGTYKAGDLGKESLRNEEHEMEAKTKELPPWLLKSSKEQFEEWGVNEESGTPFPSPENIVQYLIKDDQPVPRYLLPPNHPKHIPPHVVAYDLIHRERRLLNERRELLSKLKGKGLVDGGELDGTTATTSNDMVKVAVEE